MKRSRREPIEPISGGNHVGNHRNWRAAGHRPVVLRLLVVPVILVAALVAAFFLVMLGSIMGNPVIGAIIIIMVVGGVIIIPLMSREKPRYPVPGPEEF